MKKEETEQSKAAAAEAAMAEAAAEAVTEVVAAAEEAASETAANAETAADAPAEEAAAAPGGAPLSPAAMAALAQFAASLTGEDREVLAAVLTRLSRLAAAEQEAARLAEEEACLAALEGDRAFADIRRRRAGMQELIEALPWLRALPLRDRLAAACCLDRGRRVPSPTTEEERLEAVLGDPALLRALAERQARARRAGGEGLPPTPAPGRAPACLKAPPASLSEAKAEAKRALRVR